MNFPKELVNKTKEVWGTNTELHKAMDEKNWTKVLHCLPPATENDTSEKVSVGAGWTLFVLENNLVKISEETATRLITQIGLLQSQFE